ncbi:PTS glucose transporter subunit IIA [Lactiplantibacillus paraplantarum]|uniref:PTS glucose transporter subunit IIA n=1 Tax=Lactiplantibacillus paraplantarum TaxID=60520 RepID=UPI002551F8CF|nr:PTS glucose transporter subunit IIA [Lactiplantibacillus paraplantarum]MDL2063035.1 PTS glucose transporter subunit IIA [Lactiplantibacillus paraplantarum]
MPVTISSLIPVVAPVKRQIISVTTLANTVHLYGLLGFKKQILPATDQIVAPFAGVITAVAANQRLIGFRATNGLVGWLRIGQLTSVLESPTFKFKVKAGDQVVGGQMLVEVMSILAQRRQLSKSAVTLTIRHAIIRLREQLLAASNQVDPMGTVIAGITTSMAGNHRVAAIGPPQLD